MPVDPKDKNPNLEKIVEDSSAALKNSYPDYVFYGKTQATVSGLPAYITEGVASLGVEFDLKMRILQLAVLDSQKESQIIITLTAPDTDWQIYKDVFSEILKSFELI
jgi:hypothetical protein